MRILLVGAHGTLGRAVAEALSHHEVIAASRSGGERVDLDGAASIAELYRRVGEVDAVACAAGVTPFGPLGDLTLHQFSAGLDNKLLGQIALVRLGLDHVTATGSFTLVSGVIGEEPVRAGSVAATVNGGLQGFVRAAAIELPRGLRINAVSPTALTESWDAYGPSFPGFEPVPAANAARAFVKSIEGAQTGQIYRVGY
jgi:NAD(P)-dependent dehydrogenase (short-subunit alcohol dehydrogenase family)